MTDSETFALDKTLLGEGAYGRVRLARQGDDALAAKKVAAHQPRQRDRLMQEVSIHRSLHSAATGPEQPIGAERILQFRRAVLARGQVDATKRLGDKHYLFLELAEGNVATLAKPLVEPGMAKMLKDSLGITADVKQAMLKHLVRQTLEGLVYLKSQNVIHRDLTEANILLDQNGNVKLSDFGLAERLGPEGISGFRGTPLYLAPELFQKAFSDKTVRCSEKVDMWAVGGLVHELFVGLANTGDQELIKDDKFTDAYRDQRNHFWEGYKSELAEGDPLRDLLDGLLEPNPEKRLSAQEALNHPFLAEASEPLSADEVAQHWQNLIRFVQNTRA